MTPFSRPQSVQKKWRSNQWITGICDNVSMASCCNSALENKWARSGHWVSREWSSNCTFMPITCGLVVTAQLEGELQLVRQRSKGT